MLSREIACTICLWYRSTGYQTLIYRLQCEHSTTWSRTLSHAALLKHKCESEGILQLIEFPFPTKSSFHSSIVLFKSTLVFCSLNMVAIDTIGTYFCKNIIFLFEQEKKKFLHFKSSVILIQSALRGFRVRIIHCMNM